MFENLQFESERLITGQLCKADTPTLFQMYSDREAMKYRGSGPMKSIAEAEKMVVDQLKINGQSSALRLAIRNKPNNHLIGTLLLKWDENKPTQCEIGFSFGKQYWNNGYGKETFKMIEERLKSVEEVEEIKAWCRNENIASIRIFEKAGFSKVGQNEYPESILFIKKLTR